MCVCVCVCVCVFELMCARRITVISFVTVMVNDGLVMVVVIIKWVEIMNVESSKAMLSLQ